MNTKKNREHSGIFSISLNIFAALQLSSFIQFTLWSILNEDHDEGYFYRRQDGGDKEKNNVTALTRRKSTVR